jgi:hypothetical protein
MHSRFNKNVSEKTPDEIKKEKKREYYRKYNLENNEKLKKQKQLLRQKKKLMAEKAEAKKAEKHTETAIERTLQSQY